VARNETDWRANSLNKRPTIFNGDLPRTPSSRQGDSVTRRPVDSRLYRSNEGDNLARARAWIRQGRAEKPQERV
jgi:hypothetical protein